MFTKKHIHFVGIGGIGMSAIAQVLFQKGFKVSGSDISQNQITKKLQKKIKIYFSHKARNINNADLIVHSSAIKLNNIELKSAIKKKIPIFSRAMMLAEIMRIKPSITIAGSHGKTTTTSMIANILEDSGHDPTILSGGIINGLEINAKLGKGEWIVAEADESDGSFMFLPSTVGVINNIDLEHVDFYRNINHLKESFLKYADHIPFFGFISLGIDSKNVKIILPKIIGKKIITFGLIDEANFQAINIKIIKKNGEVATSFDLIEKFEKKKIIRNIIFPMLGEHNVKNVLASISVSRGLNISYTKIKKSLKNFKGVKRRFTILYKSKDNLIVDDYAHHPVEITSTLKSLRVITKNKIISVFEPHRYTRLSEMISKFIDSFRYSDQIIILPVYSAGEKKKLIDSSFFYKKLKKKYKKKLIYLFSNERNTFNILKKQMEPGNNIIFLGAGISSKIALNFCEFLSGT